MTDKELTVTLINLLTTIRSETDEVDMYTHTLLTFLHVAKAGKSGTTSLELEKLLGMATSSVYRNTRILAQGRDGSSKALGLLKVEEDPLERRRKIISLTEKGEKLVSKLASQMGGVLTT